MLLKISKTLGFIIFGLLFFVACPLLADTPPKEDEPNKPSSKEGELKQTIELLENETHRKNIIKLLKLLDSLDSEVKQGDAKKNLPEKVVINEDDHQQDSVIGEGTESLRKNIAILLAGIPIAVKNFINTVNLLIIPANIKLWYPYTLTMLAWGLACLLITKIILSRFTVIPHYESSWFHSVRAVARYLIIASWPSILLICYFLLIPPPSNTAAGITADLGIALSFLHSLIQHFFITMSVLFIILRIIEVLFSINTEHDGALKLHVNIARHFLHTCKMVVIYVAMFIFIRSSFLDVFTSGYLYSITMSLLFLPVPFYSTARIIKLWRLIKQAEIEKVVSSDDFSADEAATDDENEVNAGIDSGQKHDIIEYGANKLLKSYWHVIGIIVMWVLSLLFIFNPLNVANFFLSKLLSSLGLFVICLICIRVERLLMLRASDGSMDKRKELLLSVDTLTNAIVWFIGFLFLTEIWGLPLETLLKNRMIENILMRGFGIIIILILLIFFIKFSRMATDWLLSIPGFSQNRNWRTVTPLVLTAVRAMAIFVGIVAILERLGVNIGPILAGAGILGLGVGMGAQSLVKDLINGVSILLMDTLSVGDYITIGGRSGKVEQVGLRTIRMRDAFGNLIVVPNSSINDIVNMTRDYSQDLIEYVVPSDADPDKMLALTKKVAEGLDKAPEWQKFIKSPTTVMGITAFDANGTTIRVKIHTEAGHHWAVGRELRLRLKRAMLNAGMKSNWFGNSVFLYHGETDQQGNPHKIYLFSDEEEK